MFKKEFDIIEKEGYYFEKLRDFELFTCLVLKYFYNKGETDVSQCLASICDGANDGGIDFLMVDPEDEQTLLVGQCKLISKISNTSDIVGWFKKMSSTIDNLKKGIFSHYSNSLQKKYLNTWDDLGIAQTDKHPHIKLVVFIGGEMSDNQKNTVNKLLKEEKGLNSFDCEFYDSIDINHRINDINEEAPYVVFDKVTFFKKSGMIEYTDSEEKLDGILVNISANSLRELAIKHMGKGLFEQNFRYFVENRNIDSAVKKSITEKRDLFWFKNNGIIIGCHDFRIEGNEIKLENFSIINGCQTTTLLSKDNSINEGKDFHIACKIIKANNADEDFGLIEDVAEASNSQKPIKSRDLKSNRGEQKRLRKDLQDFDPTLYLLIKRGQEKKERKRIKKEDKIENEKLGQLILAFNFQMPGTARNNKSKIFNNNDVYKMIFLHRGNDKPETLVNIRQLVDLYYKIFNIKKSLMNREDIEDDQKIILQNSELSIIAIIGFFIKIERELLTKNSTIPDWETSLQLDNIRGKIFSDYSGDDFDDKLEQLVINLVNALLSVYNNNQNNFTSVSNLFKTDSNYTKYIIKSMLQTIKNPWEMQKFQPLIEIFNTQKPSKTQG
tara:strand:- start:2185 stop:4014 length:1830 start_codon:yes stop_codon:yes gene_type:complete